VAAADGFNYSGALVDLGGDWTAERLSGFLEKPSSYASGTSMSFAGLKKIEDRVNVIAYLDSLDN
jgi:cytochrome c